MLLFLWHQTVSLIILQGSRADWTQRALLRTIDFYTNGPREPLTWVLMSDEVDQILVPPGAVIISSMGNTEYVAGRQWSLQDGTTEVGVQPTSI